MMAMDEKEMGKKSLLISDYFNNSSFRNTFKETNRIEDMYKSVEAKFAVIFSGIVILFLCILYLLNLSDIEKFVDAISGLILTLIGGYISLIAFSVAALALTLSFIDNKELMRYVQFDKEVNKDETKFVIRNKEFLQIYRDIAFRFYHSAFFNFLAIIVLIICYTYINIPLDFPVFVNIFLGVFPIYYCVYCLIFNITLVNDCIKMKFSNFYY